MKRISLAIGNFDGVHLGHQALLLRAKEQMDELVVVYFDPHPVQFLRPSELVLRILDNQQRAEALRRFGATQLQAVKFDADLAALSGEGFFTRHLAPLQPRRIVVGEGFRFGNKRASGTQELDQMAKNIGCELVVFPGQKDSGGLISSSRIRTFLKEAKLLEAKALLGREFSFRGQVVEGKKLGRTLGFPTANLRLPAERRGVLPIANGVYGGKHDRLGRFMMNVGFNPTVSPNTPNELEKIKVEAHFFNFSGELYGQDLEIAPLIYLREEKKFPSLEGLKDQLQRDKENVLKGLGE